MGDFSKLQCTSASLFDLDHTLLNVNISYKFGAYLYRHHLFSSFCMLQLVVIYALHKLGIFSMSQLHELIFQRLFKGRSSEEILKHVESFLDEEFEKALNLKVFERFSLAKKNHEFTAILSSSPDFLVKAIAKRLGATEVRGSVYNLDKDQRFCEIASLMQGQEKADYIAELKRRGIHNLRNVTAYSDSVLDFPFLRAADKVVAVKPDRKLKKICQTLGWEVI